MQTFFKELFNYNHSMNQELIRALLQHESAVSEKTLKLANHILNAQHTWNSRITTLPPKYKVWEIQPLKNLLDIDLKNHQASLQIVTSVDFDRVIEYTNSQGHAYKNTAKDILFHIINHSTYHRGQIASDMKQCGLTPQVSDYIFYKR